jgi:thiamine-monophosphate kinase
MPSEFEIIRRYFDRAPRAADRSHRAVLGVGDDAALLRTAAGAELAVATDMLLEGRHFLPGADPRALGHKSLAVNLSDMAAMGATPRWATLAIALPSDDEAWLAAYAEGLFALAERFEVELIGGDTTRGPLTFSITILGEVPAGRALLRSGARAGDDIWVSGELGGAALGLAHLRGHAPLAAQEARPLLARLNEPEPRVELGKRLLGVATSAIDVSDGFAGDLGHILERSAVGAQVRYEALPRPPVLRRLADAALARRCVLSGGDDYELIFTAAPARRSAIERLAARIDLALTRVGEIEAGPPVLRVSDAAGRPLPHAGGFDHFASPS